MSLNLGASSKIKLMTYISHDTFDALCTSADGANGNEAKHLAIQLLNAFDVLSASADGANGIKAKHLASLVLKNTCQHES